MPLPGFLGGYPPPVRRRVRHGSHCCLTHSLSCWPVLCTRASFCFLLSHIVDLSPMPYLFRPLCMSPTASDPRALCPPMRQQYPLCMKDITDENTDQTQRCKDPGRHAGAQAECHGASYELSVGLPEGGEPDIVRACEESWWNLANSSCVRAGAITCQGLWACVMSWNGRPAGRRNIGIEAFVSQAQVILKSSKSTDRASNRADSDTIQTGSTLDLKKR